MDEHPSDSVDLNRYIIRALPDTAVTYEQLRTTVAGAALRPLISSLSEDVHHPAIVAAILCVKNVFDNLSDLELTSFRISKWLFMTVTNDDTGINESRGLACEIIAWQFLTFLSERELVDYLLHEIPSSHQSNSDTRDAENGGPRQLPTPRHPTGPVDEWSSLLVHDSSSSSTPSKPPRSSSSTPEHTSAQQVNGGTTAFVVEGDLSMSFSGMNALEIAAVASAKKFLSQRVVQRVVEDIWNGEVIFFESISVHATKKPQRYNKRCVICSTTKLWSTRLMVYRFADPYARLRVPKYQKLFQAAFFVSFLILYYAVLVERNPRRVSATEVFLYIWIGSFAYDELGELMDAGIMFYQTDFWSLWDLAIIGIGAAFFITRAYTTWSSTHSTPDFARCHWPCKGQQSHY